MKTLKTFTQKNISYLRPLVLACFIIALASTSYAQPLLKETRVGNKVVSKKTDIVFLTKNDIKDKGIISEFKVKGYPNPYFNEINFAFDTPIKGQARLELYKKSDGQRIAFVIIKRLDAQKSCTLTYNIPSEQRVALIYKLSIGTLSATGELDPVENVSIR